MDQQKSQISFGFKKKIQSKVDESKLVKDSDHTEENDDTESENKLEKKELIIPLIKKNRWRDVEANGVKETNDLDVAAAKELMQESQQFLDKVSANTDSEQFDSMAVPLLMKNKIPEGYETDERLNVSLRAEEASMADYNEVPIQAYGMAMIRGMGWDPNVGIGRTFKQNTKVLEANVRPKGLGLGANAIKPKGNSKQQQDSNDKLEIKKGAYVLVESGSHKRKYGVIEAIETDNAQCLVKFALDGKSASVGQFALKAVTSKEYKSYGKDLSRFSSASLKKEEEKIAEMESVKRKHDVDNKDKHKNKKRKHDHREEEHRKKHEKSKKRGYENHTTAEKYRESPEHKHKSKKARKKSRTWLRPHLRVRMVDEKFKRGQYYREKLVVEDVLDASGKCTCRTADGLVLEGITEDMLETVVPRSTSDAYVVVITRGRLKHDGKLAKILEKDKASCKAYLQLLDDRDVALHVGFDEMCEFAGDIEAEATF